MSGYTTQQYDSLGNLIQTWDSNGRQENFAYDAADNRTASIVSASGPPSPPVELVNLLDNANFVMNQRGYVFGSPVPAANTYTVDRWRVVTAGQAVSLSVNAGVRTVTAPAGGIEQVIEGLWIAGDTYTLSWTGTAVATVNGTAIGNGSAVALPGGANATVRFSNGTFSLPQLQRGGIATPFEWRHPALEFTLCARYFQRIDPVVLFRAVAGGSFAGGITSFTFLTGMRTVPSASLIFTSGNYNNPLVAVGSTGGFIWFAAGTTPGDFAGYTVLLSAEF